MKRTQAKETCSREGQSVHLPIPRFPEENKFYQVYFGDEKLWLGVSKEVILRKSLGVTQRIYRTDDGQILFGVLTEFSPEFTEFVEIQINEYSWINGTTALNSGLDSVSMSNSGQWIGSDEMELLDTVCIFNILPDDCSKCLNQEYCRYKYGNRDEVECVCPDSTRGDHCEINLCPECLNGGQCYIHPKTSETECVCIHPFYGEKCEFNEAVEDETDDQDDDEEITVRPADRPEGFGPGGRT